MVPVGKISKFKKYNLEKGESVGRRQKAKSFRYDYWCLSAFVFQSYWTDYSTSLQTIRQLFGSASFLVPFMWHLQKPVTNNKALLYFFFSPNQMLRVLEIAGFFFYSVCVCVCVRTSMCVITQKLAKGDDLFYSTLCLTHPLVLHQEAEV